MPNNDTLIMEMLLRSGLAQYPDRKLYNAAVMLPPEERPVVPVEMAPENYKAGTNTQATYLPIHAKYNPDRVRVLVQGKAPDYKGFDRRPNRLAALIAHEGAHSRGLDEADAYQLQHDVLKRMGEKDQNLLRLLLERSQKERVKETAARAKGEETK